MATTEQIKAGIGNYIQTRLMPRLDGKRQFLLGTVYGLCVNKMDTLIAHAAQNPTVRALGVVQENGEIDIDALYSAALAQMQAQGKVSVDISLLGTFAFDENDLRELRQMIGG